jgi:hypothetical protein
MPGLDGDQPAESRTEHEDRPDPQHTAGREEQDAKPANRIAVYGPKLPSVRVSRQIGIEHAEEPKGCKDPAVAPILAQTGAEVSAGEQRYARQSGERERECHQRWMGEEAREPAPAEDGQPEIGDGADNDEHEPGRQRHRLT